MSARLFAYIGIIVGIVLFFGYIKPTYTGPITSLQNQITTENTNIVSATTYVAKQTELEQQLNQISGKDLSRVALVLPNTNNNVQLILNLNSLAQQDGFYLYNFDVGNETNTQQTTNKTSAVPYHSENLTVSGIGTYNSFRQFLNGIELSLRLIDVTNIVIKNSNVTGSTNANGVNNLSYKITMRVYWLPSVLTATTTSATSRL